MRKKLKLKIPKYRQRYVCFSACFANILWHFNRNIGSLKQLEFEITKKATAYPYLFILLPSLASIGIKKYGLDAILYQSRKDIPGFEEAKKEYDKWGMKFYRITNLSKEIFSFEPEEITKENYEFIKTKYEESLNEAIELGLKVVIAEPEPQLLINDLEEGRLSLWVKMLNSYGHSNLLYGYNNEVESFYFFDPLTGGVMVKYKNVKEYLKAPVMYLGLSLKSHKLLESQEKLKKKIISSHKFLNTFFKTFETKI